MPEIRLMACVAFLMEGMEKNVDLLSMSPEFTPVFSIQGGKTVWWVSFGLGLWPSVGCQGNSRFLCIQHKLKTSP